jgi:hypothetical protein
MSVCQIGAEDRTERGYRAKRNTDASQRYVSRCVSQSEKQSNTGNSHRGWQNSTFIGTVLTGTIVPLTAVFGIKVQIRRLNRHFNAGLRRGFRQSASWRVRTFHHIGPMRHFSHQRKWCG